MKRGLIIIWIVMVSTTVLAQTLEEYYLIAIENNPSLKASYKKFEASMEKISQVNSLPDPTLSMGLFVSPVETRVGPQRVRFSLSQMFPWFGSLKARGDLAAARAEVQFQLFQEEKNKLLFQVAKAYYPLYEWKKLVQVERENIELLESYKLIVESKIKSGQGSVVNVLRIDLRLKDSKTLLEILNKNEKSLKAGFNQLLNRDLDSEVEIADFPGIEPPNENYRQDSLLIHNPVLKKLDLEIRASEVAIDVVRLNSNPKFGLGLDYVIVGERTDLPNPPEDNGKDIFMPMVSFSLPIFRKQYQSAIREEELKKESFELQKTGYSNTLLSEYESVIYEMERELDLIDLYQNQVEDINEILNLMMTTYGNSGIEFEELLTVQQELLKYKKSVIKAQTNFLVNKAKLDYITSKSY